MDVDEAAPAPEVSVVKKTLPGDATEKLCNGDVVNKEKPNGVNGEESRSVTLRYDVIDL